MGLLRDTYNITKINTTGIEYEMKSMEYLVLVKNKISIYIIIKTL